jgi:ribosomal protein S18 acetylase RimI-like enzyme
MDDSAVSVVRVRFTDYETGVKEMLYEYHKSVAQGFNEKLAEEPGDHEFSTESYVKGELAKDCAYLERTDSERPLVVALDDDRLVGCVYLYELSANEAEIKRLYVRATYRGIGLGRRLMDKLVETAEREGYSTLRLDTAPFMDRAKHLYSELGFEPYEGGESISDIPQSISDDIMYMRLRLHDHGQR